MSDSLLTVEQLAVAIVHLHAVKYFQLASFVMLIYDHMLTFDREVERIWKRQLSGATILFLINRYATPIQFTIILNAFHDPAWTKEACTRFVAFEGSTTVALIAICELIMVLRIYALYGRNNWVLSFLLFLWVAQIIVSSAGLSQGYPAPLPPNLIGCIFTSTSKLFPTLWVTPLITGTVIFVMTLMKMRSYTKLVQGAPTLHVFVRDGTLYFLVIFMANLFNTLIYFTAPPDLKAIGASFSQCITSAMISRLVLNLRALSVQEAFDDSSYMHDSYSHGQPPESFVTRTMNDLGQKRMDCRTEHRTEHNHSRRLSTIRLHGLVHSRPSVELRSTQV